MAQECDECITIVRELRDAYSEALKDPKAREFYSAAVEGNGERLARTFYKLRPWRGADISPETELFMELATEVLRELTPRDRAVHRLTIHCLRTGHRPAIKLF